MNWRDTAQCKDTDTDLFFSRSPRLQTKAREICNACPVWEECLDFALSVEATGEYYRMGIYGGFDPVERGKLEEAS